MKLVIYRIDLDIENGSPMGYATFVEKIRCFASDAEKRLVIFFISSGRCSYLSWGIDPVHRYYITVAPQCPFPDAMLGALNSSSFDAVFVQFCQCWLALVLRPLAYDERRCR